MPLQLRRALALVAFSTATAAANSCGISRPAGAVQTALDALRQSLGVGGGDWGDAVDLSGGNVVVDEPTGKLAEFRFWEGGRGFILGFGVRFGVLVSCGARVVRTANSPINC